MALTTITVTEQFLPEVPGGPVPSGYVEFELSERIHDDSGNEAEPEPITAALAHAYTLTGTATSGTFTLTWNNLTTATISATAAASTVLAALQALEGFPAAATATGGALGTAPVVVTVPGDPSGLSVNGTSLVGGTVTIAEAASISQPLYANDDTTTVPAGSYYTATFFLAGIAARNPVEITVPHTAGAGTCTLASLS
jgi:hypothetical protein